MKEITVNVPQDVLEHLQACECVGNQIRLIRQLDRTAYVKVDKFLQLMGAKWNKKAKAHVFADGANAEDVLDSVLLTGKVADLKKTFQFFETPLWLANKMYQLAAKERRAPIKFVMEPSAGMGAILKALPHELHPTTIAIEIQPKNCEFIAKRFPEVKLTQASFFDAHGSMKFDAVLMNPPFSNGQYISHIIHALGKLEKGGILVAVTPVSWQYHGGKLYSEFRRLLEDAYRRGDGGHEDLPEDAFKESGTNVKTTLIWLRR